MLDLFSCLFKTFKEPNKDFCELCLEISKMSKVTVKFKKMHILKFAIVNIIHIL